jgi:plasmid stabilization system protein ParE
MLYKLKITDLAHEDIDAIVGHIAIKLAAPKAASNFANRVEDCYKTLRSNPWIYQLCEDSHLASKGYHRVPVGNYLVFYKIDDYST